MGHSVLCPYRDWQGRGGDEVKGHARARFWAHFGEEEARSRFNGMRSKAIARTERGDIAAVLLGRCRQEATGLSRHVPGQPSVSNTNDLLPPIPVFSLD